jgi:hypothetical protein
MLTIEEYEAKRNARYERLTKAAEKASAESNQLINTASSMASIIPFGQPILVGHHSEGRDRNYRGRIDSKFRKGFELAKKAEELKSRAASTASNDAIYSDNPEAVDLLSEKIAKMEARQELMKATNKAIKKNDRETLLKLGHAEAIVNRWLDPAPMEWPGKGYAAFELTNNNANIRTAKKRAEQVQKKQSIPDKDEEINGIKIEWRAGENRIRIYFPARVDMETFKKLKSHGYRVLRSEGEGAFSAYYNNNAAWFVKELRGEQAKKQEEEYSKSFPNTEEGEKQANQYMEENENMAVIEVTKEEIRLK